LENFIKQYEADLPLLRRYYRFSIPQYEQCMAEGWIPTQIYGVGEVPLSSFYSDYERLASGNYALSLSHDNKPIYDAGDIISLENEEGESRDFEIIGVIEDYPYSISAQFSTIPGQTIVLADNVFINFFEPSGAMQVNFNVDEARQPETELWLAEFTTLNNPALSYISRETLKNQFSDMKRTYLMMGGAMSFIFAMVGILNFINMVVASIISRRREFAMLQSVGMTGKQLRSTLFFEGVCFTVLTAAFTLTAGLGLTWLIVKVMAGQTWFFKQYITVTPSAISLVPLFAVCVIVPLVCYAKLNRDSLVERLRVE
jgi:putative ABC transport system permease protein